MSDKADSNFEIMEDCDLLKNIQSKNLITATRVSNDKVTVTHIFNYKHPKP